MKKLLCTLLLCMLLLSAAAAQNPMAHVVDQAGTFSASEIRALENRMQAIWDRYAFDTLIVTTNNSRGQTAQMYAADFYDEFRSYDDYPNGLVFSFNFDLGEYYEATRGLGQTILTSQGEDDLYNILAPYLPQRDYYSAMQAYLDNVEGRISRYALAGPDGSYTLTNQRQLPTIPQAAAQAGEYILFMLLGGLVIGLVAALIMKSRLLIAKPQPDAQRYTVPNSLSLRDSSDLFLYQTVTRTRIQENRTGGGGGSSGGGSFRSSGGGSYGGRGGKL